MAGDGQPDSPTPTLRSQAREGGQGAALAALALVVVVLLSFLFALHGQFRGYQTPGRQHDEAPYGAVHEDDVATTFGKWEAGADALSEFDPLAPADLLRVRAGVAALFAVTLAAFLVLLIRRWKVGNWLIPIVVIGSLAGLVEVLFELALAYRPDDRYARAWPLLTIFKWGCPALCLLLTLIIKRRDVGEGVGVYRGSPAVARVILAAAVAFVAVASGGDIGAQAEDMLRRELDLPAWEAVLRLGGTLVLYLLVLAIVRHIDVEPGKAPEPARLFAYGLGTGVTGGLVVWVAGGGAALLALSALLLLVALLSTLLNKHVEGQPSARWSRRPFMLVGGSFTVLGTAVLFLRGEGGAGLVWGLLLLIAGLSVWWAAARTPADSDEDGRWLYVLAAVLPPLGLVMLGGRLLAAEVATTGQWLFLLLVELVLLLLGLVVGWRFLYKGTMGAVAPAAADNASTQQVAERVERAVRFGWRTLVLLGVVLVGVLFAGTVAIEAPDLMAGVGRATGALGALLLLLAFIAALGGLIRLLAADWERPAAFRGLQRTPVVGLLVVWFLLAALVMARLEQNDRSPHESRLLARGEVAASCDDDAILRSLGPTAEDHPEAADALCVWLATRARGAGDQRVPLVLVTASGGGVRAATWTERVLDCLLLAAPDGGTDPCGEGRVADGRQDPWPSLFAGGGASGGSVGLASTVAQRLAPVDDSGDWVKVLGGRDHIGPVVAHMTLGELTIAASGLTPAHDRAEVLIDGWAGVFGRVEAECLDDEQVEDVGFLELRANCRAETPLLLLNGTVVSTGRRFNIAPIPGSDGAGKDKPDGSTDLLDTLCADQDLKFFDAAFLSARFPFVTPSGRFLSGDDAGCDRVQPSAVDVVDGGYNENDGKAQIVELIRVLQPMLASYQTDRPSNHRPVQLAVVEIENGVNAVEHPLDDAPDLAGDLVLTDRRDLRSAFGEPVRPLQAGLQVSRQSETRRAKERLCGLTRGGDSIPHLLFRLHPHPGTRLPLGWALTDHVIDDIDRTFRLDVNLDEADRFRDLLAGGDGGETDLCADLCPELGP